MSLERKYRVIVGPHVSEKTTRVGELDQKQIVFKVLPSATKGEIKTSVEALFNVKVDGVQVVNMKPKKRRFGQTEGKTNAWKKAYVRLKEGFDINFASETA